MKAKFFIITAVVCLLFSFSCKREREEFPRTEQERIVSEVEKPEPIDIPEPKSKQEEVKQDETIESPQVLEKKENYDDPFYDNETTPDILHKVVTDFSGFETHPLDRFLGKWILINNDGGTDVKSYIEIFTNGSEYEYYFDYYGSKETGKLLFVMMTHTILQPNNNNSPCNIIGEPSPIDGTRRILLDNEGPLGVFQLELKEVEKGD